MTINKRIGGLTKQRKKHDSCRFCNTSRSHPWLRLMDKDACSPFWSWVSNAVLPLFWTGREQKQTYRHTGIVWRLNQQHMEIMDDKVILRLQRTVVTLSSAPAIHDNQLMARDKSVLGHSQLSTWCSCRKSSVQYTFPAQVWNSSFFSFKCNWKFHTLANRYPIFRHPIDRNRTTWQYWNIMEYLRNTPSNTQCLAALLKAVLTAVACASGWFRQSQRPDQVALSKSVDHDMLDNAESARGPQCAHKCKWLSNGDNHCPNSLDPVHHAPAIDVNKRKRIKIPPCAHNSPHFGKCFQYKARST